MGRKEKKITQHDVLGKAIIKAYNAGDLVIENGRIIVNKEKGGKGRANTKKNDKRDA